ncbi:hypothetical protein [Duganella sp. LjRoot269]|uniref:hypothetical protein n=1 Tax=Duganella sp. LjRoot269 TaxID=3342305 RepID=UPI003ECD14CF
MANVFLDGQMHSIARHLVKLEKKVESRFGGKLDVVAEVEEINFKYGLVPAADLASFSREISDLVVFEKNRVVKKLDPIGFGKFKLDDLMGKNSVQKMDDELDVGLGGKTV